MSKFKQQFHSLRRDHLAARYPGDLASDIGFDSSITPLPFFRRPFFLNVALAAAACALIAFSLWYQFDDSAVPPPSSLDFSAVSLSSNVLDLSLPTLTPDSVTPAQPQTQSAWWPWHVFDG